MIKKPLSCGFADKSFNWRDYIDLEDMDPATEKMMVETLNDFSQTEEFQELMKEMLRVNAGEKVVIGEGETNEYNPRAHRVSLNVEQIANMEYTGTDGNIYPMTFESTLYHELVHTAEPPLDSPERYLKVLDCGLEKTLSGPLFDVESLAGPSAFLKYSDIIDYDVETKSFTFDLDTPLGRELLEHLEEKGVEFEDFYEQAHRSSTRVMASLSYEKIATKNQNEFLSKYYDVVPENGYFSKGPGGTPELERAEFNGPDCL